MVQLYEVGVAERDGIVQELFLFDQRIVFLCRALLLEVVKIYLFCIFLLPSIKTYIPYAFLYFCLISCLCYFFLATCTHTLSTRKLNGRLYSYLSTQPYILKYKYAEPHPSSHCKTQLFKVLDFNFNYV